MEILIRLLCFHIFESVFNLLFWVKNLTLVRIIYSTFTINVFFYSIYILQSLLLAFHDNGIDLFGQVFVIIIIEISMVNDFQNHVFKIYSLFPLYNLNLQY